jgi:hypothetical protein
MRGRLGHNMGTSIYYILFLSPSRPYYFYHRQLHTDLLTPPLTPYIFTYYIVDSYLRPEGESVTCA